MTTDDRNAVELIKEAWGAYEYDEGTGWDLVSRLATALEDAVMRIAEAAELHQRFAVVPGDSFCKTCQRVEDFWPCETAVALGLSEGENDGD